MIAGFEQPTAGRIRLYGQDVTRLPPYERDVNTVRITSYNVCYTKLLRKLGEVCNQYLKKGDQAYFEGNLQSRSFEDSNGNTRWITEVKAKEMVLLGGGASSTEEADKEAVAARNNFV